MGNITGNSQIINHGPDDLFIGDNEFASEVLSLAAATTAKTVMFLCATVQAENLNLQML